MEKTLQKILIDIIPVVIGILIVLAINNWQAKKSDEQFINKTLSSVKKEIIENEKELIDIIPKHDSLQMSIKRYADNDTINLATIINEIGGFKALALSNSSWKAFLNSKMELIDFKTISLLSDIDEARETMKFQMNKVMDFVYSDGNMVSTSYGTKETFRMIVMDIIYTEERLLELHQELLKQKRM
ncbi:MAG: hypothetical protein AB8B53_08610 [Flavobacteriales bacterium]